jgi:hypothetical protein
MQVVKVKIDTTARKKGGGINQENKKGAKLFIQLKRVPTDSQY